MITHEQFSELKKMPEENSQIEYRRIFSELEYEKLKGGLKANSMDQKWNGYFFNGAFYFYRSWTGACIYKFELRKDYEGYTIENAYVNRNQEQYKASDDDYDVLLLDFLVSNLILGESKPFPLRYGSDRPKGVEQHSTAGTSYPEKSYNKKN